jgi:hypothetical protein
MGYKVSKNKPSETSNKELGKESSSHIESKNDSTSIPVSESASNEMTPRNSPQKQRASSGKRRELSPSPEGIISPKPERGSSPKPHRGSSPKPMKPSKNRFANLKSVAIVVDSNEEAYINYVIGRLKMSNDVGTMDYGFCTKYCINKYDHLVYVLELNGDNSTKPLFENLRRNLTSSGKVYLAVLLGESGKVTEKDIKSYRDMFDEIILNYPTALWPKY